MLMVFMNQLGIFVLKLAFLESLYSVHCGTVFFFWSNSFGSGSESKLAQGQVTGRLEYSLVMLFEAENCWHKRTRLVFKTINRGTLQWSK